LNSSIRLGTCLYGASGATLLADNGSTFAVLFLLARKKAPSATITEAIPTTAPTAIPAMAPLLRLFEEDECDITEVVDVDWVVFEEAVVVGIADPVKRLSDEVETEDKDVVLDDTTIRFQFIL
jgi:hypothetical protein